MPLRLFVALAALLFSLDARAQSFGFQRVDFISEDLGTFVNYELPTMPAYPLGGALRFVEQVKVVFDLPMEGWSVGASISSQSLAYEVPLQGLPGFYWSAALQTRLLLPRGVTTGVAWRWKHLRLGAGVSIASSAAWSHLDWSSWSVLPTIGIGVGRAFGE